MALPSLLPTMRRSSVMGRRQSDWNDMTTLQGEMNRVFDDFFNRMGIAPFRTLEAQMTTFSPKIDISETSKKVIITAELAGMDEKDISVNLEDNNLILSGERKEIKKKEEEEYCCREMTYGSFQRIIPLDTRVDAEKVEAKFRNGILTVTLPKLSVTQERKGKQIEIKS